MLLVNSTPVVGMQEIDAAHLAGISGAAYFWDDLQGPVTSSTDTTTTNLIPLPR